MLIIMNLCGLVKFNYAKIHANLAIFEEVDFKDGAEMARERTELTINSSSPHT